MSSEMLITGIKSHRENPEISRCSMPPDQTVSRQVEAHLTRYSPCTHTGPYQPCFSNTHGNREVDFAMQMLNRYEQFQTSTGGISSKAKSRFSHKKTSLNCVLHGSGNTKPRSCTLSTSTLGLKFQGLYAVLVIRV